LHPQLNCLRNFKEEFMIYRLGTGARTGLKHRLFSGLFVLMVTAGFPVLASWLNYENLNLTNHPVAEETDGGSVLGVSTDNGAGSNGGGGGNIIVSQQAPLATTPITKPISTTPRSKSLAPVNPSLVPVAPVPTTPILPSTPSVTETPTPAAPDPVPVDPPADPTPPLDPLVQQVTEPLAPVTDQLGL
jgi:hypothetical protein